MCYLELKERAHYLVRDSKALFAKVNNKHMPIQGLLHLGQEVIFHKVTNFSQISMVYQKFQSVDLFHFVKMSIKMPQVNFCKSKIIQTLKM